MIWIDSISDLEYFDSNGRWGCYGDPVFSPHDILLQAQYSGFDLSATNTIVVNILKPDGTFIEDASSYFDRGFFSFVLDGITYYYSNIRCNNYSPGMLSNSCFALEVIISNTGGVTYFHKYTQKYELINTAVVPTGVIVVDPTGAGNTASLCGITSVTDSCGDTYVELLAEFECIDNFTGDYYGTGTFFGGAGVVPFDFVRRCYIKGRKKAAPKDLKTTVSINNRVQRSETYITAELVGDTPFPVWKMEEIENMMLTNHFFVNGEEWKIKGGTAFKQFGKPITGVYVYQLSMMLYQRYVWQTFGCTPVCDAQDYYYAISF